MANVDPFEEFQNRLMRDALGLNDSSLEASALGLPQGIQSLDQLPPRVAEQRILENRDSLGVQVTDRLIARVHERADAEISNRSSVNTMSDALRSFGINDPNVSDEETRDIVNKSFGEAQANFVGDTAASANPLQGLLAVVPYLANENFRRGRSAKARLRGVLTMDAYESLKGAGAISNFELEQARPSVNELNDVSVSQDVAYESLQRLDQVNKLAQFRQMNNIYVDESTGQEWETNNNTGQSKKVYTSRDPDTGIYTKNDVPDGEEVYNFPFVFNEQQFKSFYDSVPNGTIIIREGQAFRKGQ